jgi:hypothetical protein
MPIRHPRVKGLVYALTFLATAGILAAASSTSFAQTPQAADSLVLQKAENVEVWREYIASRKEFKVWITWDESPDSLSAIIHQPDTVGWSVVTPPGLLSMPSTRGSYTGDIDRTLEFRVAAGGVVGQDSVPISYTIKREEEWSGLLDVGAPYTPNTWIPIVFKNLSGDRLDLGVELKFTPGIVDTAGTFVVGLEDFEGYHIWRGVEPDGRDLEIIGELSKEEAFAGGHPGGSLIDSTYWYGVIPALRSPAGVYRSPVSIECLGFTIEVPLESNQLLWYDCNAYNGFTYQYLVTPFDRGYSVTSGRQGLNKYGRCEPDTLGNALPDSCIAELAAISIEVDPQDNLKEVYAVPNPYRSGGSRLTTANYHNFPDEKIRFVNVPTSCLIKIFTVSGDLVWEYKHTGGGNIEWDATNRGGESVASGVYLYRVEDDEGGQVYGRLIIIR